MSVAKNSGSLITEIATLQVTLESIEAYTSKIPDMANQMTRLDERVEHIKNQVEKLETRVNKQIEDGHKCRQETTIAKIVQDLLSTGEKINTNIQDDIRTKEKLDVAKEEVLEIIQTRKSTSSTMTGILVSLAFFLASTIGGTIWWGASLNSQVDINREKIQVIENHIKTAPPIVGSQAETVLVPHKALPSKIEN